jgi:RHS repeat-associated protein
LTAAEAVSLDSHEVGLAAQSWASPLTQHGVALLAAPRVSGKQSGAGTAALSAKLGDLGAPVSLPGGRHGFVESTSPLLVPSASGDRPVDLTLTRTTAGYAPKRASAPISFAAALSGGVTLPGGLRVAPTASAATAPVVVANRLVFPNALRDTDVVEQPLPGGFETSWVLRSEHSPAALATSLTLPAGSALKSDPVITGAIDVSQDGRLMLRAKPVTATDADGAAVPASYAIEGSQLVVLVRAGGDTRFPVLVDPVWQEFSGNAPTSPTGPGPWEGWVSSQGTSPSYFYAIQSGGAVNPTLNSAYYLFESATFNPPQGATGGWAVAAPNFGLPGGTWIPRVDLINVNYNTTGHSSFNALTLGGGPASLPIWTRNGFTGPQGVQPFTSTAAFAYPTGLAFCPQYGGGNDTTGTTGPGLCDYDQPIGASIFTEYLTSFGGATGNDNAWFDGADVQFVDNTPPDQVSLTGIPTAWVQHGPTNAVVSGHDQGLGTSVVDVEIPKGTIYKFANGTCGYYQTGLPPAQPCQYAATGTMDLSGLPEGDYTIYGGAYDPALNVSYAPQQIKIDHTPPVLGTLTGSLATAAAAGQPLTLPVYSLTAPATDATSGVQSVTAAINNCPGFTPAPASQPNPADGAPLTDQITLNALACTRGMHTLTVTATDRAGNPATTTLSFDLEPQSGGAAYFQYETQRLDDRMSLSENIGTGNLALTANDVAIAGTAGMDLDVTRTYNALAYPNLKTQAQADARDLSPGWRLSIGPDVHIDTANLPAGDVRYYDPTGGTHVFTPSGTAGVFTPAPGLPATLTQNTITGTYALNFLAGGSFAFAAAASSTAPAPLTRETDANGNSVLVNYVPATCGTAVGCEISTIQGAQGQTLTFGYNGAGQLSQISDATGRKWQYNYDANGNLNLYTDPTGDQTTYQYNPTTDLLTGVTDPNGNAAGSNPAAHTTTIVYTQTPATNQVATVTEPDGTAHGQVTSFTHSPNETDVTSPTGYGTTSGYVTKYLLDNFGRIVETTDPDGLATGTAWTQNADGTPSTTMTNALSSDPSTGATTTTKYKADGDYRPTQATEQSGATTKCTYASTGPNQFVPSSCTDDLGHILNYTYDANNNLQTVSGTVNGQTQTPVNLSYNAPNGALAGTVAQSVDGNNNKTLYQYNSLGQIITTTPPAIAPPAAPLGNTTNTYDFAGRVHSTTDGAGRTTTYTYDGDDRTLTSVTAGGGGGTTTLTYTYDGNGNETSVTDPSGKTTYTPDAANRLVRELRPDGTAAVYGFDEDDNLTSLNDGINDIESFTYDAADRLHTVTATTATGPETWTYAYQYTSPPSLAMQLTGTTITDPTGIVEQDTLSNGQLTAITYTGTSGVLTSFNYNYTLPSSVVSDLVQSRTTQDGTATTYGYDTFDRLTSAVSTVAGSQTASYQYTYDGAGNRTIQIANGTTTSYAYNAGNELSSATPHGGAARAFTYDGAGDQLRDSTGESAAYNELNQTATFTGPTNLNPTYRGAGQSDRTSVVSGLLTGAVSPTDSSVGTTSIKNTTLLRLGLGGNDNTTPGNTQVIRDPAGNLLGISITSSLLNLGLGGATTNFTYATDDEGSVAAVYDANQKAQDSYTYDPYGNTAATEAAPQPFRFQGAYEDATGLYHMGQRYYDPTTGRWLQVDPSPDRADPAASAYGFVNADPVNFDDPDGTSLKSLIHRVTHSPFVKDVEDTVDGITHSQFVEDVIDPIRNLAAKIGESALGKLVGKGVSGAACVDLLKKLALGEHIGPVGYIEGLVGCFAFAAK